MEEPSFRHAYWTTANGETLKLKELDDAHLRSCIRMIRRKVRRVWGGMPSNKECLPNIYHKLLKERAYRKRDTPLNKIQTNYNI